MSCTAARAGTLPGRRPGRRGPAAVQRQAGGLAFGLDQRIAQLVLPAARDGGEPALQVLAVHRRRHGVGRDAHREVDARQLRSGQQHVEVDVRALEGLQQDASGTSGAAAWRSSRAARTPGRRRSGRTGPSTGTGAAGAARPGRGCRSPSRTARPESGTGRRAGRSPACAAGPWPGGRRARSRRARSRPPCAAAAASRWCVPHRRRR